MHANLPTLHWYAQCTSWMSETLVIVDVAIGQELQDHETQCVDVTAKRDGLFTSLKLWGCIPCINTARAEKEE